MYYKILPLTGEYDLKINLRKIIYRLELINIFLIPPVRVVLSYSKEMRILSFSVL